MESLDMVVFSKIQRLLWCVPRRGFFSFKTTGSVVVRSSQEHVSLFVVTCPVSKKVRLFVILG